MMVDFRYALITYRAMLRSWWSFNLANWACLYLRENDVVIFESLHIFGNVLLGYKPGIRKTQDEEDSNRRERKETTKNAGKMILK